MNNDGFHPISPRFRGPGRLAHQWRGLVLAAGVAFQQLGHAPDRAERPLPPYVLLMPEEPDGFSVREVVGSHVLTELLDLDLIDRDEPRRADRSN